MPPRKGGRFTASKQPRGKLGTKKAQKTSNAQVDAEAEAATEVEAARVKAEAEAAEVERLHVEEEARVKAEAAAAEVEAARVKAEAEAAEVEPTRTVHYPSKRPAAKSPPKNQSVLSKRQKAQSPVRAPIGAPVAATCNAARTEQQAHAPPALQPAPMQVDPQHAPPTAPTSAAHHSRDRPVVTPSPGTNAHFANHIPHSAASSSADNYGPAEPPTVPLWAQSAADTAQRAAEEREKIVDEVREQLRSEYEAENALLLENMQSAFHAEALNAQYALETLLEIWGEEGSGDDAALKTAFSVFGEYKECVAAMKLGESCACRRCAGAHVRARSSGAPSPTSTNLPAISPHTPYPRAACAVPDHSYTPGEMFRVSKPTWHTNQYRASATVCEEFVKLKLGEDSMGAFFTQWYGKQTREARMEFVEQNHKMRSDVADHLRSAQKALERAPALWQETVIMKYRQNFSLKQLRELRRDLFKEWSEDGKVRRAHGCTHARTHARTPARTHARTPAAPTLAPPFPIAFPLVSDLAPRPHLDPAETQ